MKWDLLSTAQQAKIERINFLLKIAYVRTVSICVYDVYLDSPLVGSPYVSNTFLKSYWS